MAWRMTGQMHELCSCKVWCPCWLGPAEPDQGWCSAALIHDIQQGTCDGVNLGGTKVVLAADWPGDFWGGKGTARLYIDAANADQRRELEAIFSGKKGGPFEAVGGLITNWLAAQAAKIEVQWGDSPSITVGNVGQVKSQRLKDPAGRLTMVQGAAAMAAFQIESTNLARADGSRWSDPDMRRWEGSSGTISTFNWSG